LPTAETHRFSDFSSLDELFGDQRRRSLKTVEHHHCVYASALGCCGHPTRTSMSLILAVLRRIPETHAPLARGKWRGDYYQYDQCGVELEDSTAGLIGYGAIGSRVARMLRGFGCHVLVYDPYLKAEVLGDLAQKVELDELLSRSRIVSLHARATPETSGMIGAKQLAAMPAGSVLINCARGTLVDYDAVCDALASGHLWGAGFDVFPEEPIPAHSRLLTTPHIVMTPHIAGASKQTAEKAALIAAGEVRRFLDGEPLEHCVNPEAVGKSRPVARLLQKSPARIRLPSKA
jgi:D-3-phosphoglycerate dehydrogenase / 2-oxoglutarate reductase